MIPNFPYIVLDLLQDYVAKRAECLNQQKEQLQIVTVSGISVTRFRNYFNNMWPFIKMKICLMATKNSQRCFQIWLNTK